MRTALGYLVDLYLQTHTFFREVLTSLGYLIEDALDAWGDDE